MKEWTPNGLGIQINYTDPLMIGKGDDQVLTTLKNPAMFVSKASGKSVPKDKATSVKFSPPQVPKGVSEKALIKDATEANNAMIALIFVQLAAQILLKSSMNDLWGMFFTL
jgi:hypothetical protein